MSKTPIHLNLVIRGTGHHPGSWRHGASHPDQTVKLNYYAGIAQHAEAALLDSILIPDRLAYPNTGLEPFTLLSAVAVRTQKIGLIASAYTRYNEPYHVARKLAALDVISGGRAGWSIQTYRSEAEDQNYGHIPADEDGGFRRAKEFFKVTRALFDSWEDDAPVFDREKGIISDPTKIRPINHSGEYYSVDGPLNAPRPVQGHPVFAVSRVGEHNLKFAAKFGEVITPGYKTLEDTVEFRQRVLALAESKGRDPQSIRVIAPLLFTLAETEAAARDRQELLDGLVDELPDRYRPTFVGTPVQLADYLEQWFTEGAADGFGLRPSLQEADFALFAAAVVPELQRRGLFRTAYEGNTLREHFGLARPVHPGHPVTTDTGQTQLAVA